MAGIEAPHNAQAASPWLPSPTAPAVASPSDTASEHLLGQAAWQEADKVTWQEAPTVIQNRNTNIE